MSRKMVIVLMSDREDKIIIKEREDYDKQDDFENWVDNMLGVTEEELRGFTKCVKK